MKQQDTYNLAHNVKDRQSFLEFLNVLEREFIDHPDRFENHSIDTFLNAVRAWVCDKHKYQIMNGVKEYELNNLDWKAIATIFLAGKTYE